MLTGTPVTRWVWTRYYGCSRLKFSVALAGRSVKNILVHLDGAAQRAYGTSSWTPQAPISGSKDRRIRPACCAYFRVSRVQGARCAAMKKGGPERCAKFALGTGTTYSFPRPAESLPERRNVVASLTRITAPNRRRQSLDTAALARSHGRAPYPRHRTPRPNLAPKRKPYTTCSCCSADLDTALLCRTQSGGTGSMN